MVTFEKLDYWRELEQQDTDMPSTRVRLGSVRYYSKSTDGQQNEFIEESKMRNFSNPVAELLKAEEENAVQTKDTGEHDDRASSSGTLMCCGLLLGKLMQRQNIAAGVVSGAPTPVSACSYADLRFRARIILATAALHVNLYLAALGMMLASKYLVKPPAL
jgi:hypothetical protein